MYSTENNTAEQTRPFWETLDSPAREIYGLLALAKITLRQRGAEPDLIEFLDREIADIEHQWRAGR